MSQSVGCRWFNGQFFKISTVKFGETMANSMTGELEREVCHLQSHSKSASAQTH